MEHQRVIVDTDVLIEFFRIEQKDRSIFKRIQRKYQGCSVSAVTLFEFAFGAYLGELEDSSWNIIFQNIEVIPLDEGIARRAAKIASQLKRSNLEVGFQDSIIAATCLHLDYQLVTKNIKHFSRIKGLQILNLSKL